MTAPLVEVLVAARAAGFLGDGPVKPHVDHAEGFALAWEAAGGQAAGPAGQAVDLGSGGGLPGLPLALRWPGSRWVLVDSAERRVTFLREAVARLGIESRVDVVRARAEELGRDGAWRGSAELVVARSFGPPAVTAECAAPLLLVGGRLVVSEPPADEGARWPADGLARVGLAPAQIVRSAVGGYAVMAQERLCPDAYPRRVGVPAKRPLF